MGPPLISSRLYPLADKEKTHTLAQYLYLQEFGRRLRKATCLHPDLFKHWACFTPFYFWETSQLPFVSSAFNDRWSDKLRTLIKDLMEEAYEDDTEVSQAEMDNRLKEIEDDYCNEVNNQMGFWPEFQ